ncbi:hypothetical protein PIB30_038061 [Stylosanthes scabra]|uniref:Uncharacterized protein n=1 Tax=Stylosanthes scabra TaxID=79078 RepID=A0ABU6WDV8_9FABA|nr:hypothetical protein [Stylosanthes scabra]
MEELVYLPTLDNLIEKNLLFKINVKSNNIEKDDRIYMVSNICQDEDLVKQYLPEDFITQQTASLAELGGSISLEVSQAVVNLQIDFNEEKSEYYLRMNDDERTVKRSGDVFPLRANAYIRIPILGFQLSSTINLV